MSMAERDATKNKLIEKDERYERMKREREERLRNLVNDKKE